MKQAGLLILLLCLFFTETALALRCGNKLINLGDNKRDVYALCGEPESIDRHIERRGDVNSSAFRERFPSSTFGFGQREYKEVDIAVEEWIYDFGRTRLKQYLRFENGRLTEIESLGRGD